MPGRRLAVTTAAAVVARAARRLQLKVHWSASWRPSATELLRRLLVLGVVPPAYCSSWAACEGMLEVGGRQAHVESLDPAGNG